MCSFKTRNRRASNKVNYPHRSHLAHLRIIINTYKEDHIMNIVQVLVSNNA